MINTYYSCKNNLNVVSKWYYISNYIQVKVSIENENDVAYNHTYL